MFHLSRQTRYRNSVSQLKFIVLLGIVFMLIFSMIPVLKSKTAEAAGVKPLNLCFYGSHTSTIDQMIINAQPMFLLDNTPNGPWHGNCNASIFAAAGIKVFSYIDGGYEGTQGRAIPNSLQANLSYIDAIASEPGVYGIFVDEVSSAPTSAGISYLSQIYNRAKQHGLAVMLNTGVDSWSDSLMQYCDYMNSSEVFSGAGMTASQQKWASRTVLLSQGIGDATTAANLTNIAVSRGFLAHYACVSYGSLPSYLEAYASTLSTKNTAGDTQLPAKQNKDSVSVNLSGNVASVPVPSGANNEYCFYVDITSSTVSGLSAGEKVWCAATITDYPDLFTVGSAISGNIDHSLGWWVLKK